MIVCTAAVSVAADTVAIQPFISCAIVQNLNIKGQTETHWPFQFRAKGSFHKPFQK